ncbi:MAG: HlyD family type I secretion periplasmic adaptor subunit [Acidobacteriota bacterium]
MFKWFAQDNLEHEFLPPALEIEKAPPSPLGRLLIWIIVILVFLTGLWSYLGKVDVVAVARGKLIPDGRVKLVQPLEEGIIKSICVEEGERVKKGQILINLDSTINQADFQANESNLTYYKIERDMLVAELNGQEIDSTLWNAETLNEEAASALEYQRSLKIARETDYKAKEEAQELVINQKKSQLKAAKALLPLQKEAVRLVREEASAYTELHEAGGMSKLEVISKLKEVNQECQKLEEQKKLVAEAEDDLNGAVSALTALRMEREKEILTELEDKEKTIANLEAEVTKGKQKIQMEKLTSPVAGTVHGMASYTIGGVVTPAQPLVTIVPEETPLIVEASALNQDVGFLEVGQKVEVKIDTFPFQKYGTIPGRLEAISPDATDDEKLGPIFTIKVKLDRQWLAVNGRNVTLTPGMTASAEIKTGKRRIIEFFLSPIMKYFNESLTLR